MDAQAARRARQKTIQADLAYAYTDEEASPPEWLDLLDTARDATRDIKDSVQYETARFVAEPDIRRALAQRERFDAQVRERIERVNVQIRRLNLIAPNSRFHRGTLDADEILKPLFRAERPKSVSN
jgi:hypothetical protein